MDKKTLLTGLLLGACFIAGQAQAQTGFGGMFPGPGTVHTTGGGGGYVGPGDTLAGAVEYWGLDAVNSAYRGSKAVNICNVADVACADVNTDATTGLVPNTVVIGGVTCGVTVGVNLCMIKTWYGQVGGVNQTQTTIANRAVFTPSCIGSNPCATGTTATTYASGNVAFTAQPYTVIAVAEQTSNPGSDRVMIETYDGSTGSTVMVIPFTNGGGAAYAYAGSVLSGSETDSAFHTFQGVFNGGSSIFAVDATQNSGNAGTNGASGGNPQPFYIMSNESGAGIIGSFLGGGFWGVTASSGNLTTINTNYHSRWGY